MSDVYLSATIDATDGYDPVGVYVTVTVDVDDIDHVSDLYTDRLIEMQLEERLQIFVIPVMPLKRDVEELRRDRAAGPAIALPT